VRTGLDVGSHRVLDLGLGDYACKDAGQQGDAGGLTCEGELEWGDFAHGVCLVALLMK
jgi:hypothetical protein